LKKLRNFNKIMGGLHFVQGAIMLFLATSVIQKIGEFQPTITQNFLQFNEETRSLDWLPKSCFICRSASWLHCFSLSPLQPMPWSPSLKE